MNTGRVQIEHLVSTGVSTCEPGCLLPDGCTRERVRQHVRQTGHTARFVVKNTTVYSPAPQGPAMISAHLLVIARATRDDVLHCEPCGQPVYGQRGLNWAVHHRQFRNGQPDMHLPQNLLVVHGADNVSACHGAIHADKTAAMEAGWAITRHGDVDPLTVPVLIDGGARRVWLTEDGRYSDSPPVGAV